MVWISSRICASRLQLIKICRIPSVPCSLILIFLRHLRKCLICLAKFASAYVLAIFLPLDHFEIGVFYCFSLHPEGESVSMHLTAEASHYFCLPHLPHPLFSSELRTHLSMFWVPGRKNWCTECHVLSNSEKLSCQTRRRGIRHGRTRQTITFVFCRIQ